MRTATYFTHCFGSGGATHLNSCGRLRGVRALARAEAPRGAWRSCRRGLASWLAAARCALGVRWGAVDFGRAGGRAAAGAAATAGAWLAAPAEERRLPRGAPRVLPSQTVLCSTSHVLRSWQGRVPSVAKAPVGVLWQGALRYRTSRFALCACSQVRVVKAYLREPRDRHFVPATRRTRGRASPRACMLRSALCTRRSMGQRSGGLAPTHRVWLISSGSLAWRARRPRSPRLGVGACSE